MAPRESSRQRARDRAGHQEKRRSQSASPRKSRAEGPSSQSTSSQPLSADSLAKLNLLNQQSAKRQEAPGDKQRRKRRREVAEEKVVAERTKVQHKRRKKRAVSGGLLEEGNGQRSRGLRGGAGHERSQKDRKFKKPLLICIGIFVLLLVIIIPVAVVLSKKKGSTPGQSNAAKPSSGGTSTSSLPGVSESDIPAAAKGTYLDPFTWFDTTDFNVTYTNQTVGGLPVMGLNSTWDDSSSANSHTAPISSTWGSYGTTPARGVNIGGWLSLEPFITPSLFQYDSKLGVVDEYTLTSYLGATGAQALLEKHYATFVTEQTFIDIANAGLDHIRIPFSYWAVTTYPSDPYVFRTSWRYLLRGIEWARKHGLRVSLDLHGVPGSQNGWNHSGRQGVIGWLNGTDGTLNAQRSLDIHNQLSQFFAQDRYKNIVAFYGLVNEPRMTALQIADVLNWTASAYEIVRKNGVNAYIVFGDGFEGLANWKGQLQEYTGLVLDAHQYVIFNANLIRFNHTAKINFACSGWSAQAEESMNLATGFGPTMFAEWSQADTDCATNLNNVGVGSRWAGTLNTGDPSSQILSPVCPTADSECDCTPANADPSKYSDAYKQFLRTFAEAQMASFEKGWGWFYWTWATENSPQWSYQLGLAAGILPAKAYAPDFNCSQPLPSFSGLPETY